MADDPQVPPPDVVPVVEGAPSAPVQPPNPGEAASGPPPTGGEPAGSAEPTDKEPAIPDAESVRKAFFNKWAKEDPKTTTEEPVGDPPPEGSPAVDPETPIEKTEPVTNEQVAKLPPGEARRKLNKARERLIAAQQQLTENEPLAQLGVDVMTTAQQAGWTPQQYVQVMQATVAAQRGDPRAAEFLRKTLALPSEVKPTWTMEDEAWLTDSVASGDLSLEAAKQIRARVSKHGVAPATAPATAPAPAAPPPPPPSVPRPADVTGKIAEALERATSGVSEADMPKIDTEIKKELETYRQRHPGLDRSAYPAVIEAIATGIVQRHRAAARQVPTIRQTLKPTTTASTPATGKPSSARDALFSKW